ncbi:MAG: hypothetical protein RR869_08770 [Lachnospiraceae bacterium]
MIDYEHIEYIVKEIKKNINSPYSMANEELVNEILPVMKEKIPQIEMYQVDIRQWFIVTEKAKKKLIKVLTKEMEQYRKQASDLSKLVEKLNEDGEKQHFTN